MYLIVSLFLLFQLNNPVMTVAECLTRNGDSTVVDYTVQPEILKLSGPSVWAESDQDAVRYGAKVGRYIYFKTDTGERTAFMLAYEGRLYIFVYRHPDAPGAMGTDYWHGSCMLRLNP